MSKRILSLVKGALFFVMLIALSVCSVACDETTQTPEAPTTSAIRFVKDGNVEIEKYKSKIIQIVNENPENAITWTVEDSSIVKLDAERYADGVSAKLTALNVGSTRVTVSDGTDSISVVVNVIQAKYPPTIVVEEKIVAFTGQAYDLSTSFAYDNSVVEDIDFQYISSNESIAQVSADGAITPVSTGDVVVTVKANFMGDEIVKDVFVTVVEKPISVENKIGYFDTEYGKYQLVSEGAQLTFSENIAFDNENGSLEVFVTQDEGVFKGTFASLIQKDVSNTAYVVFRVYNPNDVAIVVEFDKGIGTTVCKSNAWTTVICKTSDIQKAEGLTDKTEDITGLTIKAYAQDGSASLKNNKLYFSSMIAQEKAEDKIGYFDTIYGAMQVTSPVDGNSNPVVDIEYSTEVKFGDEQGSTKITWNSAPAGGESAYLTDLIQKDVSAYDYLIFRIYNPSDSDIIFKFQPWFGWARCTANAWTDVKVTAEEISANGKNLGNITGLVYLFEGGEELVGKSVYLSAMYGGNEEIIEDDDGGEVEELEGVKLFNFDESGIDVYPNDTTYSTEVKYGKEAGSTKVVMSGTSTLLFEAWGFAEKDISAYDYIVFRVYNANDYAIKFMIDYITPFTTCAAGEWTEVKIPVSAFGDKKTDIGGRQFHAMDDATNQGRVGLTLYLSALYGCTEEVIEGGDEELKGTKLFNFDESGIDVYPNNTTYSTEVKYGKEAGSTKVVMSGTSTLLFEAWGFAEKDISAYDYIVFRVYNANDYAIKFMIDYITPFTTCAAGEWTEVKIPVSAFGDKKTDIGGRQFHAMDDATNQGRVGLTLYLSALYGCTEEVIEGGEEELEGTKLFNFDESTIDVYPNNTTYSTEVKYGKEAGSTKVVMSGTSTLLFEAWGFAEKDISAYDYIVFRVYNANDYAIEFMIDYITPFTTCAAGEWTEVKIPVSAFGDKKTNIGGRQFHAMDDATDQGRAGLTIYLSALYGCTEEVIEGATKN